MRLKEGDIVYLKRWFTSLQHNNRYGVKIGDRLKFIGYDVDNGGRNGMERGFIHFESPTGEEMLHLYTDQYNFETVQERRKRIIKEICK